MTEKLPEAEYKKLGAIGYCDDMSPEGLVGKHVDGVTGLVFATEDDYLGLKSPVSGRYVTEIEHLAATTTPEAAAIAEAALKRGEDRK